MTITKEPCSHTCTYFCLFHIKRSGYSTKSADSGFSCLVILGPWIFASAFAIETVQETSPFLVQETEKFCIHFISVHIRTQYNAVYGV